ncbi:Ribosomal protein S3 family protein [Hibiscus syriacus]|uniref:Ribosomal protein S3 family protein n=1 Tax=Hibiscus syriacus TaxID=106335 RepID=A0A6A2XEW8_HIBSY|nr:Ribosomal protein S3 family protein [Hibiscus syriacus]
MEGDSDTFSGQGGGDGGGGQIDSKVVQTFQKSFVQLNNNIRRVVDLYGDLSSSFAKSMDASSEGDSSGAAKPDGKTGFKRNRPA